jgi:hypothetical protein
MAAMTQRLITHLRHPKIYDVSKEANADQWGTANPFGEELAKESFNDPDRGVFVAPPV